jgi:hypothetical protein
MILDSAGTPILDSAGVYVLDSAGEQASAPDLLPVYLPAVTL